MKILEHDLRVIRDAGRKVLVAYFMGGVTPHWTDQVEAAIHAGVDAVEIGIPFSDPMMDGIVIQEAALRALDRGATMDSICADLERLRDTVPLLAMTYYNVFHHYGLERAAGLLASSGVAGAIVPDLPLEEATPWREACDRHDLATVFLVAPSTTPERVQRLAEATEGFAYATARMAVTGRSSGAGDGARVVASIRSATSVPTYIGIGITTGEQAKAASAVSDGVIVGSALVQVVLNGGGPGEIEEVVQTFRTAIDG